MQTSDRKHHPRPNWRRILAIVLAISVLAVAAATLLVSNLATRGPIDRLAFIKKRVRQHFPKAPQLSTEELERRLEAGEKIVLLDVREPEEFEVSHLPGAIRVDPKAKPQLPEGVDPTLPVVAYCSVGWRSSKWVEGLRDQGVDAMNLEGSIFEWVAEDRPLVHDGKPVHVVHPYGRAWAWLVDPEDRALTPP